MNCLFVVLSIYKFYNTALYMVCKYFLLLCELPFHLFDSVLWCTKVLNFDEIQFIFLFAVLIWLKYLRNCYLIQGNEELQICSLLRVLYIFVYGGRERSKFIFFFFLQVGIQLSQHNFLKLLLLLYWMVLGLLSKINWP